jgi:hypothetical protein
VVFLKKFLAVFCVTAVLAVATSAFAGVPVSRVDSYLERQQLSLKMALENWYKNKVLSLSNVSSIQDLANLPSRLQSLAKNLNIQSVLGNFNVSVLDDYFGTLNGELGDDLFTDLWKGDSQKDLYKIVKEEGVNEGVKALDQNVEDALADRIDKVAEGYSPENLMSSPLLDGYSESDKQAIASNAAENSAAYLEMIKDTAPLTIPDLQKGAVVSILKACPDKIDREHFMYRYSQQQKNRALASIGNIIAKYEGNDEKTYRSAMNEIVKQTEEIVKQANDAPKGNDAALIATAIFTASTMKILTLQNYALVNLGDMLADEIRLLGRMAVLETEDYSRNLYDSFMSSGVLFDKTALSTKSTSK